MTDRKQHFPFGSDDGNHGGCDTLVSCVTEMQAAAVARAFELKAEYIWGYPPIGGRQYKKIIVFFNDVSRVSDTVARTHSTWIDSMQLHLKPGGQLILV